jgi:hypothetical protein
VFPDRPGWMVTISSENRVPSARFWRDSCVLSVFGPRARSYDSGVFNDVGAKMILVSDLMVEKCLPLSYRRTGGNLYFSSSPERELRGDLGKIY